MHINERQRSIITKLFSPDRLKGKKENAVPPAEMVVEI